MGRLEGKCSSITNFSTVKSHTSVHLSEITPVFVSLRGRDMLHCMLYVTKASSGQVKVCIDALLWSPYVTIIISLAMTSRSAIRGKKTKKQENVTHHLIKVDQTQTLNRYLCCMKTSCSELFYQL